MNRLTTTTRAARLLLELEQPGEEPTPRYQDRLAEVEALVRLLSPGLRFRGLTSQIRPLGLHRYLDLPTLGRAWLDERGGWWWEPS